MSATRIACVALATVLSLVSIALCEDQKNGEGRTLSQDDQDRIAFLLASMTKSRHKMAVGECKINLTYARKKGKWADYGTEFIECAFDFPAQNYVMTRRFRQIDGKYLSTRQKSFVHTVGNAVSVHHPMEFPVLTFRPFDVRVLGWASPHFFDSHSMSFEKLLASYTNPKIWYSIEEDEAGVCKVVFRAMKPHPVEQILWLDSAKDYVPVRFESGYVEPKTGKWNTPRAIVETKWKKRGEGWFPESVVLTSYQHKGQPNETQDKRVMTFQWVSADKPLDPSRFALKSWNLRPDSLVVDVRGGEKNPVTLGRIDSIPEYSAAK